mmetsp:Transcript_45117/g.98049  ORF Transcript_45117/g.98049 Transcript_45117/m.98049 type:complete len:559 (+) Transcript_45117:59-1735(+)
MTGASRAGLALLLSAWLPDPTGGLYDPVKRIESARLYGNIDKYAYYFVDLIVGTPPQRVSVILDTGSSLCGFPCTGCPHCGNHIDPAFNFGDSSTAAWVDCGSGCHGRCREGHCAYDQSYQEGSSISGYWFEDSVSLGDAIQHNPSVRARLGCHQNENRLFYTQEANGIFGIQGPSSVLQTLFRDTTHVNSKIFAICFADWGGRLVVGGWNESYHTSELQWIPVQPGRYRVELNEMKLGGESISTRFRSTVIDSGTTYTYMGTEPYNSLRRAIEGYCQKNSDCAAVQSGTCWKIPDLEAGLAKFPTVEVYFGSVRTEWVAAAYLYRKGSTDRWCYAFENDGPNANTVLGASWMLHQEIVFDLDQNRVGVASAACPEYRERPTHRINDPVPEPEPTSTPALVSTTALPLSSTPAATAAPAPVPGTSPTSIAATTVAADSTASTSSSSLRNGTGIGRDPKNGATQLLDPDWHSPGPIVMGSALAAVLLTAFCFVRCTAHLWRQKAAPPRKTVEMDEQAPEIVGGTFEIGDDGGDDDDDDTFELVQNHELRSTARGSGPLE